MGTRRYDTSPEVSAGAIVCLCGNYSADGLGEGGASERRLRETSKATSATSTANISVAKASIAINMLTLKSTSSVSKRSA